MKIKDKFSILFDLPKQVRYVIFYGGRGSSKSFTTMSWLVSECMKEYTSCLATRYVLGTSEDSIVSEFEDKLERLKIEKYWKTRGSRGGFNSECANGSKIIFRGIVGSRGNQTAKLKSIQGITTWIAEEADEMSEKDFDTIDLSVRSKDKRNVVFLCFNPSVIGHWIYQRFFKEKSANGNDLEEGFSGVIGRTLYLHCTYEDNLDNLEPSFVQGAEELKNVNYKKYANLFLGHWLKGNEMGFQLQNFNQFDLAKFKTNGMNIYTLVDPASGKNKSKKEDYTVIVTIALAQDNNYYLIHGIRKKLTLQQKWQEIKNIHAKYHPIAIGYEEYGMQADIAFLRLQMESENYRFPITELGGSISKKDRIDQLIPVHEKNQFYYPQEKQLLFKDQDGFFKDFILEYKNNEYLLYPLCVNHATLHDDMLDCIARILDPKLNAKFPLIQNKQQNHNSNRSNYNPFEY